MVCENVGLEEHYKFPIKPNTQLDHLLVVDTGTSLSVSAGSDLEKEGTVHFVLLGSEDTGQIFSHYRVRNSSETFKIMRGRQSECVESSILN